MPFDELVGYTWLLVFGTFFLPKLTPQPLKQLFEGMIGLALLPMIAVLFMLGTSYDGSGGGGVPDDYVPGPEGARRL